MAVKTWVGRFAIVDGHPQEEGPYLRSFPRHRPDEEEDELYVLVDPATPSSEEYAGQLLDAIGRMYKQDALSLTGAVLRALRAAHQQLRDWNQRSLREHRIGAGVSCLAVRGRTAYLAQVGPSLAFHVGDGRFRRIEPEDGAAEPLGQSEQTEPSFRKYDLSAGDLLLLAPPGILDMLDEEALKSILLRGGEEALVELYRLARDQQEFSLVLLACVVEPEREEAAARPPATEEQAPPSGQDDIPGPELLEEQGEAEGAAPPPGLAQPKLRLKGSEADIRYPRTTGIRPRLPQVPPLALALAALLVAVGLIAWCVVPSALQESRDDRFSALVAEAESDLAGARDTGADASRRRIALEGAEESLAEAELLQADDPSVAAIALELEAIRIELDAVVELPGLEQVADVSGLITGAVSLSELKLGGGGAYVLDREQHRVIAVPLSAPNPEPVVILEEGSLVGTEVVGQPRDIAWAAELNSLLVLDDAGRLVAVAPGQAPRMLTVRDAQAWGSADDILSAGGKLYILDGAGSQVWRYLPTETGFDSERVPLLDSAIIEQAKEIAVGKAVYVLTEEGAIRRYQLGSEQPFPQSGIDQELASPASPILVPAAGWLMVADRGNDRIVIFTLDGTFVGQAKSAKFSTDLRAINVDRNAGILYILVGGVIYRTPLLPPQ